MSVSCAALAGFGVAVPSEPDPAFAPAIVSVRYHSAEDAARRPITKVRMMAMVVAVGPIVVGPRDR